MCSLSESSTQTSHLSALPCALRAGAEAGRREGEVARREVICSLQAGPPPRGAASCPGLPCWLLSPVLPVERRGDGELDAQHGAGDGVQLSLQLRVGGWGRGWGGGWSG